jgi:FKBP-type peptidyl-prolyl cis-trans isomerase SlyD
MRITSRKVATIDYTLTDASGAIVDSSKEAGPLTYLHGFENIIPGLEAALEGREPGDSFEIKVPAEEAYGERDEELIEAIPRNRFPKDVQVGMRFEAEADGESRIFTVVAIDEKGITVDGNHPLAGQSLSFEVTVVEVRDATSQELDHGHVHDHGHDH